MLLDDSFPKGGSLEWSNPWLSIWQNLGPIGSVALIHQFSSSCRWTNHMLIPYYLLVLTWTMPLKSSPYFHDNSVSSLRVHLDPQILQQPVWQALSLGMISKKSDFKDEPTPFNLCTYLTSSNNVNQVAGIKHKVWNWPSYASSSSNCRPLESM